MDSQENIEEGGIQQERPHNNQIAEGSQNGQRPQKQPNNRSGKRMQRLLGSSQLANYNILKNTAQQAAIAIKHLILPLLRQRTSGSGVQATVWQIYKSIRTNRGSVQRISVLFQQYNQVKFEKYYSMVDAVYNHRIMGAACEIYRSVIRETLSNLTSSDLMNYINSKKRQIDQTRLLEYLKWIILQNNTNHNMVKPRAQSQRISRVRDDIKRRKTQARQQRSIDDYKDYE